MRQAAFLTTYHMISIRQAHRYRGSRGRNPPDMDVRGPRTGCRAGACPPPAPFSAACGVPLVGSGRDREHGRRVEGGFAHTTRAVASELDEVIRHHRDVDDLVDLPRAERGRRHPPERAPAVATD